MSTHGSSGPAPQGTGPATTTTTTNNVTNSNANVNDWSASEKASAKAERSASQFVRLKEDGEKITFTAVQPPFPFLQHSMGKGSAPVRCPGSAQCAHCRKERPKQVHSFAIVATGDNARRVLTVSDTTFKDFRSVAMRYPPDRNSYEMTRHGRAGDPKTRYMILPAGPIPTETLTVRDSTPALDLDALSWGGERPRPMTNEVDVENPFGP